MNKMHDHVIAADPNKHDWIQEREYSTILTYTLCDQCRFFRVPFYSFDKLLS